jgi:hypothetical protein
MVLTTHGHFHGRQFPTARFIFFTAGFELFGRSHGHLATLVIRLFLRQGLLPLLASATSPNNEVDVLEPTQVQC